MQYRASLDGLRAVAVLSVVVFHINARYLTGGFLGVDIFFVISGYLITLLLVKDITKTGRLNLIDFYRRRIQRIFPALLFMLVSTLVVGYLLLVPKDYTALSTSALWSLFSAANIYFFSLIHTGYFARGNEELPLLHLWSLGVEEQFYILWPFIVWFLGKVKSTIPRLVIISVFFALSLAAAQLLLHSYQSFAYYMLPTRAWELMAGGLLALVVFSGIGLNKLWSEVAACIGAVAIGCSLAYVSQNDNVPGLAALPVVLGSVLLLLSGDNTLVGRFLSLKPMVAIGLVSYSAYLWHWPLLAFLKYALIEIDVLGVLVATFALASVSYFVVEKPLRTQKINSKKVFVWYFTVPIIVVASLVVMMIQLIAVKNPLIYEWQKYAAIKFDTRATNAYPFSCQYDNFPVKAFALERCISPLGTHPTVLLVGDSHAAHYMGMLRVFADHYGFSFRNATQSSCAMLLDVSNQRWVSEKYARGCTTYRSAVKSQLSKYDTVIIGGSWINYDQLWGEEFRLKFKNTLSTVSSQVKNVIVLADVPSVLGYHRECPSRSIRMPHLQCETRYLKNSEAASINKYLHVLSDTYPNVHIFDIRGQLCKDDMCSPYFNGNPVYYDSGHLSMVGSQEMGEKMIKDNDPYLSVFEKISDFSLPKNY